MNTRERRLQTRIAGDGRNAAAVARAVGDIGSMVEPTPAVKWSKATVSPSATKYTGQTTDMIGQRWSGRWYGIVHIAQTQDGDPSATGNTVTFSKGAVLATFTPNAAYLVMSDEDGKIELTVDTGSTAARMVYAEVLGKPTNAARDTVLPPIFAFMYQQAIGIDYGDLPITTEGMQEFVAMHLTDLATFQAAVAAKFPDGPSSTGRGLLDLEEAPTNLPFTASEYADAGWPTIRDLIISYFDWARENYPDVIWSEYQGPSLIYADAISDDSTNRDAWRDTLCTTGNLEAVVARVDSMNPELYSRNRVETQEDVSLFMQREMVLSQAVRTASGNSACTIDPIIYVTDVTTEQFLTAEHLAMYLIACREAGADSIYMSGAHGLFSPEVWQTWADTTLTEALTIAGYIE